MTEKKKTPKEDDPNQSEAFRKAVRDLEAAGELSPTEADEAFNRALEKTRNFNSSVTTRES